MAQTIEDVNGRTLLQQFHELYKKQDEIETNVENVDAKVDKEKSDRQSADAGLQKAINQEATARADADAGLQSSINANATSIANLQNSKVDKETGKGLSTNDFTNEYKTKIDTNATNIANNTTQITALKSDKQDKLTAGTNITIDANNVISASGGLQEVTASDVNSEQATSGQVLTANGSGGASWQNASGGEKLYIHTIAFGSTPSPGSTPKPYYCKIYSKRQAVFSSMAELGQYLYEKNEIVLTTWKYRFVAGSAYWPSPLAIRGVDDSSDDYFQYLNGQRLDFAINDGKIEITSEAPALWFSGSLLGHGYFEDNVSEL